LSGLAGSAPAWALAELVRARLARRGEGLPLLVVAAGHEEASRLLVELSLYLRDELPVVLFPADDVRPYEGFSPHPGIPRQRLVALDLLERRVPAVIVTTGRALMHRVLPPDTLRANRIELRPRMELDRRSFLRRLSDWGYLAAGACDEPGTVSARGELIDLWPAGRAEPVRVGLFDEEIEDIRPLDPGTQRCIGKPLPRLRVLPAREAILSEEALARAAIRLAAGVDAAGGGQKTRRRILEDLREGLWFPGAEDYLGALHALVDPLSYAEHVAVVGSDQVMDEIERFQATIRGRWEIERPEDRPLSPPEDRYASAGDVVAGLRGALRLDAFAPDAPDLGARDNAALRVGTNELAPLAERLRAWLSEGWQLVFTVESLARAERLRALFDPHRIRPRTLPPGELPPPGTPGLWVSDLTRGFHAAPSRLAIVAADELFAQRSHARPTKSLREATVSSFAQLKSGDFVVHARHGVGRFEGMARLPVQQTEEVWGFERTVQKLEQDFVIVSYRDGDRLYLPVTRLGELARYQAIGDGEPKVDRLGGESWSKRKAKVKDRVLAMAGELLRTHALRTVSKGHAYEGLPELYRQFEQTFPYVETPDQEAAIRDVLDDLAQPEPMDRLIIGDVGFGKTEVAMRAAMRVVLDGYQAIVLCPTTVLAFQHFQTFKERFADVPVEIELLSRLRTPAEGAEVLSRFAAGRVDILVGTTAVLGRTLRPRKLGLIVVDEEHRFGVKQKEKLSKLAIDVDMLAMSATPIPRTLHMALSGLRKVSVIATPPAERQAIRTRVARSNEAHIREEILHELQRGGQVFFVHNRVQGLPAVAGRIRELVPEARVATAHGQMEATALEDVLISFLKHEIHVLVCTSIIESGIDMPNVNTMIVDRADQLGLAQLYQLRGRVGRGSVRGHCTLLLPEGGVPPDAMRRLQVLQENTELGAGFAIANADLELRGAGNLLGAEQHGQIEAVGLDTYLELLEEAVAEVRGELAKHTIEPEVEIPVPALLPEDYVPELEDRLAEYRRLAVCRTVLQVRELLDAWEDRYGRPPPEVLNLGWLGEVRARCRELGIQRVHWLKVRVVLDFHESTTIPPARIARLLAGEPNRFTLPRRRVAPGTGGAEQAEPWRIEVRFAPEEAETPFRFLHFVFERLASG